MDEESILLLTKYLNNQCTEQELVKVAELLTDPLNQDQLSGLLAQASEKFHGHFETSSTHRQRSWSKIRAELPVGRNMAHGRTKRPQKWIRLAASVALIIGVVLLYRWSGSGMLNSADEVAVQMKTVSNALGKKSKLTLPDGTVVIMNSGTTVTYPEKFSADIRSVSLIGEAYFDVKESVYHPFVVESKGVRTKVLGTTFNIRANPYFDDVKVSLTSGKVAMQLPGDRDDLILEPGQEIIYHPETNLYEINEFAIDEVLGWQRGILCFDEASEQEAVSILEHWYDVRIEVINSTAHEWEHLTAKYDNEPLENVLISLGYTLDFTHEIRGRHIKIIYK